MTPSRVIVVGLGKAADFSADRVRSVAASSYRALRASSATSAATIAHGAGIGGLDVKGLQ